MNTLAIKTALSLVTLSLAVPAHAQAEPAAAESADAEQSSPSVDFELDPLAYALGGYSLHAGLRWSRLRLDLGAFALDTPEALHGAEGLNVYGSGFGLKLDYYPFEPQTGLFVGAQLNRFREDIARTDGSAGTHSSNLSAGLRIGYQIDIISGFYASPWVGVDYAFANRSRTVGGVEYAPSQLLFFPTVHLGKKF